jgi:hypothetical protein
MINHVRTLLLNVAGPLAGDSDTPGDALVPVYAPAVFSPGVDTLRRALFGTDPDYAGRLYRLAQFMRVLHAEDEAHVLAADPRVTYALDTEFSGYGTTLVARAGSGAISLTEPIAHQPGTGRVVRTWMILALSPTRVTARQVHTGAELETDITFSGGVSSAAALPGTTAKFRLHGTGTSVGNAWTIDVRQRLTPGVVALLEVAKTLEGTREVFAGVTGEPGTTFRNMFYSHPNPLRQLCGLLLALAAYTERIRQQ